MDPILEEVVFAPRNFSAKIDLDSVTFFKKSTGESTTIEKDPDGVLVDLLTTLGVDAEHV